MPHKRPTEKGAEDLANHVFGEDKNLGGVGLGKETYFIYMYMTRSEWSGSTFHRWQGCRVSWKWNYGKPLEGKTDGEQRKRSTLQEHKEE